MMRNNWFKKTAPDNNAVSVVDGARTPFLKARGKPGPFSAADLAVYAGRALLNQHGLTPECIDEVVLGCVMPSEDEANIARVVGCRMGCDPKTPAWTVQRNCASGMQALDSAMKDIVLGRHNLVLAGGTEAMSRAPLLLNPTMVHWLADLRTLRGRMARLRHWAKLRPPHFRLIIALLQGLTDPLVGLTMGQTAEILSQQYGITREAMDAFAVASHQKRAKTTVMEPIIPLYDTTGHCYEADDGLRPDSSVEKLATLTPYFDKKWGKVTAGNSAQITDGSAMLLLANPSAVAQHQLPVLGRIIDTAWAGVDPRIMGIGPVHATEALLARHNMKGSDIPCWEINEAFAGQVLACLKAFEATDVGPIDPKTVNQHGGAIAIGHPVGASGARIVLHLLHRMRAQKAQYGVATLCIGGGQGGAVLVEGVDHP